MKIVTIVGARPQFIKAAVVSRAISNYIDIHEVIVHTGQHFDENMSNVFFEEMLLPKPKYNLCINGLNHGAMTGQMMEKIETVLLQEKPDWVLVYGDTNSTVAGSLAAKKLHIKVAHVEAGLRSCNMNMPEEINRIITDRISDILFCPTETAIENLTKEGFENFDCQIYNVGDVMYDAALFYADKAQKPAENIPENFILSTVHRAENTDNLKNLQNIFTALETVSQKYNVVVPLHPRTKAKLESIHFNFHTSNIRFIQPVGYLEMIWLLQNCSLVMTDSGGLQKESCFFKKNCVILRLETEWIELVNNKMNILAGTDLNTIIECVEKMLKQSQTTFYQTLYGDGNAGNQIVNILRK